VTDVTELRWILLLLGALFLAGLAWWEWRRPRAPSHQGREPGFEAPERIDAPRTFREPTLTLPEIRPPSRPEDLPVLEVADESIVGLPVIDPGKPADEAPSSAPPAEPTVLSAEDIPVAQPAPPYELTEPVVDWPPEGERRIVALRLVSTAERFAGRQVRQALAAEGFVSGKMSIFHKAGPDGRAVLSAASLNKPGTFDAELMDTQRFTGLNLFAVLPGPLPAAEAFDELLSSARSLNDRLLGALQDERGEPLTQMRAAAIREQLGHAPETARAQR
jgi:FtsZ-interacting cell division protein ZipA